jgi:tetratricopeptide (TPR) repeat protein
MPLRLLALCYQAAGDASQALEVYRQAIQANPQNPRLRVELDELLAGLPGTQEQRRTLWANLPPAVLEDEPARYRGALALATLGQYQPALELLSGHTFFPEEGSSKFRDLFCQIHIVQALQVRRAGRFDQAMQSAILAASYPPHLGLATPYIRYDAPAYLLQAVLHLEAGEVDQARLALLLASEERHREANEAEFFSGLALRYLDRTAQAAERFRRLIEKAQAGLGWPESDSQYNHFLLALGDAGLNGRDFSDADTDLQFPHYRWQAFWVSRLQSAFVEIEAKGGGTGSH